MNVVYLDNAATTPVAPEVFAAMKPYFSNKFGNASEYHLLGRQAKAAIEGARQKVANFLGAKPSEIIFTGSATESINLSHKGLIEALRSFDGLRTRQDKSHIITSQIEHKAVLETCRHLEKQRLAEVTYLPVDKYGLIKVQDVKKAVRPETVMISIMSVNNEVGTIEPIKEIGDLLKKLNRVRPQRIYFHTDATQAIQYLNCHVKYLGVDLLSLTGHKIYAPKGVGALYVRAGVSLVRQLDGGGQEKGLRAGTENVPYIVGLGKAMEMVRNKKQVKSNKIKKLRERLIKGILKIPRVKLTGHPAQRAPHITSFVVEGVEGEAMVLLLSDFGIMASTGSACTASDLAPSHVLTAMGIPGESSHGSIRFSLGKETTEEDIKYVIQKLPKVIADLRKMAPKI